MSFESGSSFSGEGLGGGGLPATEDIQMEDCTMVLIAVNKRLGDAKTQLEDRVISQERGHGTIYDCKACPTHFTDAGFSNIDGALSCRSMWRDEAAQAIAGK